MSNTYSLVKKSIFLIVIYLSFLSLIINCSDNNNPGFVSETGYILLDSQVIGPTGGEINLDSIIVKIPNGALNENTELSVYVGEENDGFGEYGSSSLFQVNGLPTTINKPVKLSIKYHGTIEGDTLVAIGTMGIAVSIDSSLYAYHTENATDSAGYIVYELPAYSSLAKIAGPKNAILDGALNIIVLSSYVTLPSSNGHFKLSFPLSYYQQGVLMGEHLETAYSTCKTMGFTYTARTAWPVDVLAKPLSNANGYYQLGGFIRPNMTDADLQGWINLGKISIALNILSHDLYLRTTCGHEFLHLVQNLYEFSGSYKKEPEQRWLGEATSVWIEDKFADVDNYVSHNHQGREYYPFYGWQSSKPHRDHTKTGYGLSVIIKGIEDRYGDAGIVKIFENIRAGILPNNAVDPVDAIISILQEPISTFWHGVLSSYVLGQYYNSQVNFKFLDKPANYLKTFTVGANFTKESSESYQFPDLSGDLFKIIPGDLSTLTKVPLSFTVNDPTNCGILVCKYKQGSEITEIGNVFPGGGGEVILNDAKPLFDDGYEIVVMVSNSTHNKNSNYSGSNTAFVTIELVEPKQPVEIVDVVFNHIDTEVKITNINSGIVQTGPSNIGFAYNSEAGTSTFEGNVFTTKWSNSVLYNDILNGYMTITLLENPDRVDVSVDLERRKDAYGVIERYIFDYSGVPYIGSDDDWYGTMPYDIYHESGSIVSKINLTYSYIDQSVKKEILEYSFSAETHIEVNVVYGD